MADNTIDTLELKIESDAQQAADGIERLADKLVKLGTATEGGQSDLGKFANAMHDFAKAFKDLDGADSVIKSMGEISTMAEKINKTPLKFSSDDMEVALDKLREQFKDVGTDFKFTGSTQELEKAITNTSAQLDKLYAKEDKLKAIGENVEGSGIKSLIYDIQLLTNKLDILRNMQESVSKQDIISPTTQTMADESKQSLEEFVQEIQHYKDILKAGGIETDMGKNMNIAISGAQTTLGQLIEEFPQATKEISELQSVIDQMQKSKPFYGIDSGIKDVEGKITELQNKFGDISKAIKLSSLSSEEFQTRLNSLVVPTTLEDNLAKLQSRLRSVEEQEQKLTYQQEKGLSLGTIAFDSDAFRKYEVAIRETQLTAEMLREKIAQVTADIENKSAESARAFNENLGNLKIPEIREDNVNKLTTKLAKLEADLDKFRTNLENDITMGRIVVDDAGYQKAMEKITLTEKTIEATKQRISELGGADTGLEKTGKSMSSAQAMANLFSKAISTLVSKMEQLGKKAISVTVNDFKKFGEGVRKAISNIKKLISSIAKFVKENKKSNASMGISFKTILKYVFGIRSLYMLVRKMKQAFKEGMDNLVRYSGEVNHSVSLMTSALGALKNALAVAFSPIVSIVAPYITKFINMMTDAFNAVGRFFAALTGKKIATQATKFYKDYADSIAGVGDAAEDADKALHTLGIDELNILNENKEDKGGGGGDVGIEDMFTDVAIEGAINDWAKKIRDAFLNEDWEGLGKAIADMMNAGLQKIYDLINWKNVGPKIEKFVDAFARTFNSLVDNLDWDLLGRVIGAGINTLVNTFNLLAEKIDFENLGRKISVGLRGMIDEIDWENLGNALGNYFMIAWRMLDGFISDMARKSNAGLSGFAELGNALGNAVNGIFEKVNFETIARVLVGGLQGVIEALAHFVGTIKWGDIADNLNRGVRTLYEGIKWDSMRDKVTQFTDNFANAFNQLIRKVNWTQIGNTIGAGIDTIARAVNQLTDKMDFVGLGNRLAAGVMGIVRSVNWNEAGRALMSGFRIITNVLYGFVSDIKFDEIGVALGNALNGMVEGIDLGKVGATLGKLITGMFQMAIDFSKTFDWKKLGDSIADGINNFFKEFDGKKAAEGIFSFVSGILQSISEAIAKIDWSEVWKDIIEFLISVDWASLWINLQKAAFDLVTGIFVGLVKAITEINWGDVWRSILDSFKLFFGIHSPSTVMQEQGGFLMQGLINGITAFVEQVIAIFGNIKERIVSAWGGLIDFFNELWSGIKNSSIEIWGSIRDFLTSTFESIKDIANTVWEEIRNIIINAFSNVHETFQNVWNMVANFLSATWQNIKSIAANIWNSIAEFFGNILSGIGEKFKNAWSNIENVTKTIFDNISAFLKNLWTGLVNTATQILGNIVNYISQIWNKIKETTAQVWESIKSNLSQIWENIKTLASTAFTGTVESIKNVFNGLLSFITGAFSSGWSNAWNGIVNIFKRIFNLIPSAVESIFNGVINALNSLLGGINSIGGNFGINIPLIPNINLPRFKDGGLIMNHMIAEIGEYGRREAILPLENRKSMSMIADSIMDNRGGVSFNDEQISDELLQEQNALLREQNKLLTKIANTRPTAVLDTRDTLAGLRQQAAREGWNFT